MTPQERIAPTLASHQLPSRHTAPTLSILFHAGKNSLHDLLNPQLTLSLAWPLKGIPYTPESKRPDGSKNHGFRSLKGLPDAWRDIPEARHEPPLGAVLEVLNQASGPFFSSGCEASRNIDQDTARPIGYVEFAFNSREQCVDATSYFLLFYRLYSQMQGHYNLPVGFFWNVSRTHFGDHSFDGFSTAVFVKVLDRMPVKEAVAAWTTAWEFLKEFLEGCEIEAQSKLYDENGPIRGNG